MLCTLQYDDIDNPERAQRLAGLALDKHQGARALDVIQVSLVHGYDIGIASAWRLRHFARPPAE